MTTAVNNPNKLKGGVSARSSDGNQLTCAQRAIRKCRHRKKTLCSNLVQKTLVTEDPYYYEVRISIFSSKVLISFSIICFS